MTVTLTTLRVNVFIVTLPGSQMAVMAHTWPMLQTIVVIIVSCIRYNNLCEAHTAGKELVVWNDGQQWRCFEDLCPHRKVPLSEGRVEAGKLECAYHGWKFDSAGKTVSIPQVSRVYSLP